MGNEEFENWLKEKIKSCDKNTAMFKDKGLQHSAISSNAMMFAYELCLLNFKKITPSPTLETPQNTGGNQGEGVGEQ